MNVNVQPKTQPQPPGGVPWPGSAGRNVRGLNQYSDHPALMGTGTIVGPSLGGQRQRLPVRKGPSGGHSNMVVAEQDFQNLSLIDSENVRGRHSLTLNTNAGVGQGDWRIMDGGYSRRILSANTGQRRETG